MYSNISNILIVIVIVINKRLLLHICAKISIATKSLQFPKIMNTNKTSIVFSPVNKNIFSKKF